MGKRPLLIGVSEELNEREELQAGHIDALVISDPMELGARAMQAMQTALEEGNASRHSSRLPVYLVDKRTITGNPILNRLMPGAR